MLASSIGVPYDPLKNKTKDLRTNFEVLLNH